MDLSTSLASAHFSEMVHLAAFCALLSICQALSRWMARTTIAAILFHGHFGRCMQFSHHLPPFTSHCFYSIKVFVSLRPLIIADWALCTLTLFVLVRTCTLVMILFSSDLVSSLIISASISLSFNQGKNCLYNC